MGNVVGAALSFLGKVVGSVAEDARAFIAFVTGLIEV